MAKPDIKPSQIWAILARDWRLDFISKCDLGSGMAAIAKARVGLADEDSPTCLFPVALGDSRPSAPVVCGESASRGSHSIQRARPLTDIATCRPSGLCVYRFFPDLHHLVSETKGADGLPAHTWLWEVDSVPPKEVPISETSVGHFACDVHDKEPFLGQADNLVLSDVRGYELVEDANPPEKFRPVCESMFYLAFRTLLYRISQFRGAEKEAIKNLMSQADRANRYGVQICLDSLRDISSTLTKLSRIKNGFDRRALGDGSGIRLVHHVLPFEPSIPYAASEYIPIDHLPYRGKNRLWVSLNVLPVGGRTWLIVSHGQLAERVRASSIKSRILDMATCNPSGRKRIDFKAFADWSNVYASISDYDSLPEGDRTQIESQVAQNVCKEPFAKGLELLRSSPSGRREIERIEREIAGTTGRARWPRTEAGLYA